MSGFDPDLVAVNGANNFMAGGRISGRGDTIEIARPSDGRRYGALDSATVDQVEDQRAIGTPFVG